LVNFKSASVTERELLVTEVKRPTALEHLRVLDINRTSPSKQRQWPVPKRILIEGENFVVGEQAHGERIKVVQGAAEQQRRGEQAHMLM